jgi:hypothetical protein
MAVNGIKIEVGQKWRTREGKIAEVIHDDDHPDYPLDCRLADGHQFCVGRNGRVDGDQWPSDLDDDDLIELHEHADGFKPWAGGEQPEETRGKMVAYRVRSDDGARHRYRGDKLLWGHGHRNADIVAYKVVGEVPAEEPLKVELIEPPQDALDIQVGGDHYKSLAIQPVEYIHANDIGYFEGNVIKYVTRWRAKNGIKDLEKAKHYIDLLIDLEGGSK